MKTLIILSIVQSAFLLLLLLSKKQKSKSDAFLAFWLLVMMLSQFYYLLVFYYPESLNYRIVLLLACTPLLAGSAFLFYVAELTQLKLKNWPLHLIPFVGFLCYTFLNNRNLSIENGFLIPSGRASVTFLSYYGYLFVFIPFLYIIWSYSFYKSFEKRLKESFSNTDKINLFWLKKWIVTATVFIIVSFPSIYLATRFQLFPREYSFQLISLFNTVYIFVVGYFGLKQTSIFSDIDLPESNEAKYQKSGLTNELADVYLQRLRLLMEKDKPYLEANLRAKQLANSLGISVNNFSQLLNQYKSKTFYQYINDRRVEEVINLMKEAGNFHISSEGLAYEAGFNSRSTFMKAFKTKTGQSPAVFRKNLSSPT